MTTRPKYTSDSAGYYFSHPNIKGGEKQGPFKDLRHAQDGYQLAEFASAQPTQEETPNATGQPVADNEGSAGESTGRVRAFNARDGQTEEEDAD